MYADLSDEERRLIEKKARDASDEYALSGVGYVVMVLCMIAAYWFGVIFWPTAALILWTAIFYFLDRLIFWNVFYSLLPRARNS